MFADDTTIIKCKHHANPLIDSDIGHMSKWFVDKNLTFKVEKCEAMFSGSNQVHDIFLMVKALPNQKTCKYPGIHLKIRLKCREDIDYVVSKTWQVLWINTWQVLWINIKGPTIVPKKVIANVLQFVCQICEKKFDKIETSHGRILRALFSREKWIHWPAC